MTIRGERGGIADSDDEGVSVTATTLTGDFAIPTGLEVGDTDIEFTARRGGTYTGPVVIEWSETGGGTLESTSGETVLYNAPTSDAERAATITVTATGGGLTATYTATLNILPANTLTVDIDGPDEVFYDDRPQSFPVNVGGSAMGAIGDQWTLTSEPVISSSSYFFRPNYTIFVPSFTYPHMRRSPTSNPRAWFYPGSIGIRRLLTPVRIDATFTLEVLVTRQGLSRRATKTFAVRPYRRPPSIRYSLTAGDGTFDIRAGLPTGATIWQYRYATTVAGLASATIHNATASVEVTGVTNGTTYHVEARIPAAEAWGDRNGPWVRRTVTPKAPTPVGKLSATLTAGNGQITIRRDGLPANATGWEYRINTTTSGILAVAAVAVSGSSAVVTGLTNGQGYYVVVRATTTRDGYADGPYSVYYYAVPTA